MRSSDRVWKHNDFDEPLDECPSLAEYVTDLKALIEDSISAVKNATSYDVISPLEEAIGLLDVMADGDWRIKSDNEDYDYS